MSPRRGLSVKKSPSDIPSQASLKTYLLVVAICIFDHVSVSYTVQFNLFTKSLAFCKFLFLVILPVFASVVRVRVRVGV